MATARLSPSGPFLPSGTAGGIEWRDFDFNTSHISSGLYAEEFDWPELRAGDPIWASFGDRLGGPNPAADQLGACGAYCHEDGTAVVQLQVHASGGEAAIYSVRIFRAIPAP